jgi:hypothetical protein
MVPSGSGDRFSLLTWRVQATITLPKFQKKEPHGGLPPKLDFLNVYRERAFPRQNGLEIQLKCNAPITDVKSLQDFAPFETAGDIEMAYREPARCPYFLETTLSANSGAEAVDGVTNAMELITDFLTFQLQYPVKIVHLFARSLEKSTSGKYEGLDFSGTPPQTILKDAIVIFPTSSCTSFSASMIRTDIPEEVRAALRWFAKGQAASPVLDKFAFYWIAFETLAMKWRWKNGKIGRKYLECPRCGKPILKCPNCGKSTETKLRIGERVRCLGKELGRDEKLMNRLWRTRQMFHGEFQFGETSEAHDLAVQTQQLKALLVDAMKRKLNIPSSQAPLVQSSGPLVGGSMYMRYTIDESPESTGEFPKPH